MNPEVETWYDQFGEQDSGDDKDEKNKGKTAASPIDDDD